MASIEVTEDKGVLFNIIKYCVAALPIIVPLGILYFITNDILISIAGTLIFDFLLVVSLGLYVITSKVELKKEK